MKPIHEVVTIIGETRCRPPHRLFGIGRSDRLLHQYIVGQTGTGKSTLLLQLMMQDVNQSQGFCLIDPHGDLAQEVASLAGEKCLYWNVSDPVSPYGYNPLTHVSATYRPLIASGLIDTLKKQWTDAWGPRMEHLLRFALLALLDRPDSTLKDIIPLFIKKEFRKEVLQFIEDPLVRRFWESEYPAFNFKNAQDGVAPIANKLGAFLSHPVVRTAVCNPVKPLRFRTLMDKGTILIVNLAKGQLGADIANLMGGMIMSNIAHAAYSRQNIPEENRTPYFLYVDEFHSFTSEALADMLSELRKYQLGLILAHQYLSQLEKPVYEAILGNVGTLAVFRTGANDAAILSKQLGTDIPAPRDIINLPNYRMYIKLMVKGSQTKAFSAGTVT